MLARRPSAPLMKKNAHPHAYYMAGSIGLSASITLRDDSRARLPLTLRDVMPNPTADAIAPCLPCNTPPEYQRPNLINMKCRYFHSFTGCTRDACRFLHNEKPEDVVFLDGTETRRFRNTSYIAPGPRADVKIFIGNLPPGTVSSYVVNIASPFGEIKRCDVLRSNMRNGRCPAVLFMTSDAQATAVIAAFNAHTDAHGQRAYARKEFSYPDPEPPPYTRLTLLTQATKSATIEAKARTPPLTPPVQKSERASNKAPKPTLVEDKDGFYPASKTHKLGHAFHVPLKLSSLFTPLTDLPDDWEDAFEEDDANADECTPTNIEPFDAEVAVLTPSKPSPSFGQLPSLSSVTSSPTSIITGDWVEMGRNMARAARVMSPFPAKMLPPPKLASANPWNGWNVLGGGPAAKYSDS
jgi:hypothetical protein